MKNLLLPLLIGAAATAAITYFLISEDTAELRGQLAENLEKSWDKLKDKAADKTPSRSPEQRS
jgi:hypothetical protein